MAEDSTIALRCRELHRYLGKDEGRVHVLKGVTFEARVGPGLRDRGALGLREVDPPVPPRPPGPARRGRDLDNGTG